MRTLSLLTVTLLFTTVASAQDIDRARQMLPRDAIKSIDKPVFKKEASFLKDSDEVLGITRDGKARAYPLVILNAHEVCNDRFGNGGISVTW